MKKTIFLALFLLVCFFANASDKPRVIIDNDFCGDPDGLFQLAHSLMCGETLDIRAIIGGHLSKGDGDEPYSTKSCQKAEQLLKIMGLTGKYSVLKGSEKPMLDYKPIPSEGCKAILDEALQCSKDSPLYVLCGGALTNIASALMLKPEIEDRIVLIWIGGTEGGADGGYEFNLSMSIPAARFVFDSTTVRVWQVPYKAYRQCVYTLAEMRDKVLPCGRLGKFLYDETMKMIDEFRDHLNINMHGMYILGDSPLALFGLTGFLDDPMSSEYKTIIKNSRPILLFTRLDTRLMFSDFESRLRLWSAFLRR